MDEGNGGRELNKDIFHLELELYLHKTQTCTSGSKHISHVSVYGLAIVLHIRNNLAFILDPGTCNCFMAFHSYCTERAGSSV
jgi:hypothetical protein